MDKVRAQRIVAELRGSSVGGWTVGDYLGNGASAVVVTAVREGQTAALKLMDPELVQRFGEENQLARINRECELIGHSDPHLVKIYAGGKCSATAYLYVAMQNLPYPALTARFLRFLPIASRKIEHNSCSITSSLLNNIKNVMKK